MKLITKSPAKALKKAYYKQSITRNQIELFKNNLITLFTRINEEESEENLKNIVSDFLKDTYYKEKYEVNTKGRKDLVIHLGKTAKQLVGVIIEAKHPLNKAEMITKDKPNAKALHELMLYYLRERIDNNNKEIKYLIATNVYEWFIFDAVDFEKLFADNKRFLENYKKWKNGLFVGKTTDWFYEEIAKTQTIDNIDELTCTHFDLRLYETIVKNTNRDDDLKLVELFKILSPEYLLKQPFVNDSNQLNKEFYNELLYLLGLEEEKEGSKKIIKRKDNGKRDVGSIIENTINILNVRGKVPKLNNIEKYGETIDKQTFGIALELTITWLNRILFLKLLEGQLVKYHGGNKDYKFLYSTFIKEYDELNELFFEVLAVKHSDRKKEVNKKYGNIPYLNSSLFEITDLESNTILISELKDRLELPIYSGTVLKDPSGKRIRNNRFTLHYLFEFLDSYDFASDTSEIIQEENKTLINASVLGLIFEKINGYKDGSYFTPGFITMYMCREAIRKAVIEKFNDKYKWNCLNFNDLYNKIDKIDIKEANKIINDLKICDPAVGSGHFLVSALNEIIAIKSDLKILCDREGKRLRDYEIEIDNDELIITDIEGELFQYNYNNKESQRVQESLFHEKQQIIENCLFGVDINSNSVKICQLRLWIELLKNSYYTKESSFKELETLPNIDINIKEGDSLINRFDLKKTTFTGFNKTIYEIYKTNVQNYKNETNREKRATLKKAIEQTKSNFRGFYEDPYTKEREKISKLTEKLHALNTANLFDHKKQDKNEIKNIEQEISKLTETLAIKISNLNKIYAYSFEWRFEFPEVLDEYGKFIGFDVIIGNPPYIQLQKLREYSNTLSKQKFLTYDKTGDIYALFYEKGISLLKENGMLVYISSNKWMRAAYGEILREYFTKYTNPLQLIDFGGFQAFDAATVDTNILITQKAHYQNKTAACVLNKDFNSLNSLDDYFTQNYSNILVSNRSWIALSNIELVIKEKIEKVGVPLSNWDLKINFGIKTGFNDAFIIDEEKRNELLKKCPEAIAIINPILRGRDIEKYKANWNKLYLINSHNGIKHLNIASVHLEVDYPIIFEYLLKFKKQLITRQDKGDHWSNLRNCAYLEEFRKPKIIWKRIGSVLRFSYDETGALCLDSTCFAVGKDMKYLTGVLNSTFAKRLLLDNSPKTGTGDVITSVQALEPFIVPKVSEKQKNEIVKLVDNCIDILTKNKNADISKYEKQIDSLVYELYGLTEEEIKIVEGG